MALLVGAIIGIVLGLTGAGGSIFAVPLLVIVLHLAPQQAIGVSLGAVAISSAFGSLLRLRSGDIQWRAVMWFALLGAIFAPVGNSINRLLNGDYLLLCFSILAIFIAIRMWLAANKKPDQAEAVRAKAGRKNRAVSVVVAVGDNETFRVDLGNVAGIFASASLTGFLSGLFGVGGGFIIVPALIWAMKLSIQYAVATSLVVISVISSSGFISFLANGVLPDTNLLVQVSLGGIMGMLLGVFTSKRLAGPGLQKTFSALMILTALLTLVKALTEVAGIY